MMYTQIEKEFAHQFNNTDLDFHVEYQEAIRRVSHYKDDQVVINAVRSILSNVLAEYARTNGKRKSGKWFRRLAAVISNILKIR